MSDIRLARKALARRILEGDGKASRSERRAAFDNSGLAQPISSLVDKVARHAYRVTEEDFAAVKASSRREGIEPQRGPDLRGRGVRCGWPGHSAVRYQSFLIVRLRWKEAERAQKAASRSASHPARMAKLADAAD